MNAVAAERQPGFDDLRQAAEWFAALQDECATEVDRQAWQRWMEGGPGQRAAWQKVQDVAADMQGLARVPARQVLEGRARLGSRRRGVLRALAVLPVGGAAAWLAHRQLAWSGWTAAHRTEVGERREIVLADGGSLWLNTGSAADVDYPADLRRVVLYSGELLLTTAHDTAQPARPMVVDVEHARLRALGTRFAVRHEDGGSVRLTVFEGAVEASPAAGSPRTVRAGEQARVSRDRVEGLGNAPQQGDGWTRGVLVADRMRLGDFIADLARYRPGYLACAGSVADLRIVGAYPLGTLADTDRVLDALQATLPVQVRRTLPWWVMVDAASGASGR